LLLFGIDWKLSITQENCAQRIYFGHYFSSSRTQQNTLELIFASVLQQYIENRLENNPEIEFAQPLGYMVISLLVDCSYDTVMMKGTTIVVGAIGTR